MDRRPNRGVMDPSIALFTEVLCGTIRHIMTMLAFDTHKAVKALKEAGFDDPQAEAVVATVGEAIGGSIATKADIAELRTTTKADIAELRTTTKADIARAEITELRTATKADMTELRAEMKTDIARAEMKTDIAQLRAEMADQFSILYRHLWSMAIGIVGFTAGLTVALVKLLP